MALILASNSPRRRELLTCSAVELKGVEPSDIIEERQEGEDPTIYCQRLAIEKAQANNSSGNWVLSADTIVVLGDEVFEKPKDAQDAFDTLRRLSKGWHSVLSAWALRYVPKEGEQEVLEYGLCESKVCFRDLSDAEIWAYIDTKEPFDKAGSYGIQGKGACLVQEIQGSYSNIVGLPLREVLEAIHRHQILEKKTWESQKI